MEIETNKKYKEFLDNLNLYFNNTLKIQDQKLIKKFKKSLSQFKRIFFTGTGSSLPSALYGAQYCSEFLGLPAQFLPNGGILSINLKKNDLVFLSTQGFNRGDAELVAKKTKSDGAKLAILTANQDSIFKELADFKFYFSPFPEKLFSRPVGVQTGILAMQKIFSSDFDLKLLNKFIKNIPKNKGVSFDLETKYIVLSSGFGMPVALNYSLALREGCGIDSQCYDIETYGHGMYVSDQTEKHKGKKICYILIDIINNDHVNTSCERIKPFILNSQSSLIHETSLLPIPYAYYEILTKLANNIYATNTLNNYDMNEPYGKEENRYYHKAETYNLTNKKLGEFIENIKIESKEKKKPILIEISGGSCVGKTTFIDKIKKEFKDIQIIHQDNYQLGKNFKARKTSLYKFDDLRNFQIKKCFEDMQKLLADKKTEIPNFNLKENITIGVEKIKPRKINILEGIYASNGVLASLSSFKIYIEAPYCIRFLRRIARFVNLKQNPDLSIPLKHITSSVYLAHKDFVIKQKLKANLVLKAEEILPQFNEVISNKNILLEKILFKKENIEIGINKEKISFYLIIKQSEKIVYKNEIDLKTKKFLSTINWLEL